MSAKSITTSAVQNSAAAEMRAQAAARKTLEQLVPRAIELLGAAPTTGIGVGAGFAGIQTVALPLQGAQTLVGALRARPNWYAVSRQDIDALARLVVERNWFARSVHQLRLSVYASGFRFRDKPANDWAAEGNYPFARYAKDMIEEWLITRNIAVWWRKESTAGTLPPLNVPNNGDCEYEIVGGRPQLTVTMPRNSKLKDDQREALGDRLFEAIKKGKKLIITQDDEEFDFRVMKSGKSAAPFQVSPLVTIFDDLDFVEAIRIGDWNGAKSRWEIIRQTKKGYAPTSGSNAGNSRNNAKSAELKAIVKAMKEILGKTDIATNFDQEIGYVTFPKEHFHPELLAEVKQRLLQWAGIFGVMLLKTDSQITGLAAFLIKLLRDEVTSFREEFAPMLRSIFAAESFRGKDGSIPDLVPVWPVKPLYSAKEINELTVTLQTYGIAATATLRELFDIDHDAESKRMKDEHEDPTGVTPAFEPRQGITAALMAPAEAPNGNQNQNSAPTVVE